TSSSREQTRKARSSLNEARARHGSRSRPWRPGLTRSQQPLEGLAHGSLAAGASRDPVRSLANLTNRVLRGQRQARAPPRPQVVQVISHHCYLGPVQSEARHQLAQHSALVLHALVDFADAELRHPTGDRRRGSSRDDSDREAGPSRLDHGEAVLDVEALVMLAGWSVVKSPVGQDSIHIEDEEPDARRRLSRDTLHRILARRMSWSRITPAGRPTASVTMRWVIARSSITESAVAASSSSPISRGFGLMHSSARQSRSEP